MNWPKLKEKFPKCHDEIKALWEKTGDDGSYLLDQYFLSKGKQLFPLRIHILNQIENEL